MMIASKHELLAAMNRDQLIKTIANEEDNLKLHGVDIDEIYEGPTDNAKLRKALSKLHDRTIRRNAWKFNLIMSEEDIQRINSRLINLSERVTEILASSIKIKEEDLIARLNVFEDMHDNILNRLESSLRYKYEYKKYIAIDIDDLKKDLQIFRDKLKNDASWKRIIKGITKKILEKLGISTVRKLLSGDQRRILLSE